MAKQKSDVNKSQAVRDVLDKDPKMPVREVVKVLAEKGISVQPSLVYVVKNKARIKRKKQRRERAANLVTNGDPVATVKKVKVLAGEVGGIRKLRELVEMLAE
jgi:hypothetical protein